MHDIDQVFYYGAGCSTDERKQIVAKGLQSVFLNAQIKVSHDLDGAAIATCGSQAGIACILGTGSNACLWNGHSVDEHLCKFGLGFILGDEGSGSHIGKQLLKGYFYNDMPSHIRQAFETKFPDSKVIIQNTYAPGGNTYVASFAKFAGEYKNEPYIKDLISSVFEVYIKSHILKYKQHKEIPVNFVGSIAYLYQDLLSELSQQYGFKIGKIIKQPIEALFAFHLAQ
jgi:N-acetylglucosamine kinase-like BadF-type ATPase